MAGESLLVRDLAIVMVAAAATGVLFQRFKQPTILGYLVAGVLIGPHFLPTPLIRDAASIGTLAELGTLFLLFSLGLNFHIAKLRRVGGLAVVAGLVEMALMIGMGVLAAGLFGWRTMDALFLGAILAISGAAVIVKVLDDLGRRSAATTQLIYGIVVVEKLVAIILIALLSSLALTGGFAPEALGGLMLNIALFVLVTLVVGLLVVPRVVDHLARMRVQEMLVVAVLGIAFGLSIISSLLGLSLALGAFFAGALIAESRASILVEQRIAPLRDAFVAVFFVAMGLLVDPSDVVRYWQPILVLSAVVVFGKIIAVGMSTYIAGYPPRQAFEVGIGMAMIGGFALVIANLGQDLGVTDAFLFPVVASVTAVTTFVTPNLMRFSDRIVNSGANLVPMRVRRYSRMYTGWIGRHRPADSGIFQAIYVPGTLQMVAYAALLATLLLGVGVVLERVDRLAATLHLPENVVAAATLVIAGIVSLPVAFGLVRAARNVIDNLIQAVIPQSQMTSRAGRTAAQLLRSTMQFFAMTAGAIMLFATGSVFLPPMPLLLGAVAIVAVAAYLLRKTLRRVDQEVGETLNSILSDTAPPATRDEMLSVLQQRSDWDLQVGTVLVTPTSAAAHRRIRDLGLPRQTGSSILTHERSGIHSVNPSPDLVLEPDDILGIVGTPAQVEAAKALILQEALPPGLPESDDELVVEEIEIPSNSPVAGVPLAESHMREETGATIVGLRRGGEPIPNPRPETMLAPGDVLLVVGSPAQVARARARLAPPP